LKIKAERSLTFALDDNIGIFKDTFFVKIDISKYQQR
jgi:hypothetical protein